jgi:hypothetical protein
MIPATIVLVVMTVMTVVTLTACTTTDEDPSQSWLDSLMDGICDEADAGTKAFKR